MAESSRLAMRQRVRKFGVWLLLVAVAGGLIATTHQLGWSIDISVAGRNTLSASTQDVLRRMTTGPVQITAILEAESPLRRALRELIARYRAIKPDISLDIKDAVSTVGQDGVITSTDGDVRIEYNGRTRALRGLSERHLTSAMSALLRGDERWLVFITGHGERDPSSKTNQDWGTFGEQLQAKGFRLHHLNLAAMQPIPDNASAVVIASSQAVWLPGEVAMIQDYLARGGNVWWLVEPNGLNGLDELARALGVSFAPGLVVDPAGQRLSVQNPAYTVAMHYDPSHPITRDFKLTTVFPYATRIAVQQDDMWRATTLVSTADGAWFETGSLDGDVHFDADVDGAGPVSLSLALERPLRAATAPVRGGVVDGATQRVVVTGDGDFLANRYVGNGGNVELGLRIANWLAHDDALIDMPVHDASDRTLELSRMQLAVIGFGLLIGIPAILLAMGAVVVWRRRRR